MNYEQVQTLKELVYLYKDVTRDNRNISIGYKYTQSGSPQLVDGSDNIIDTTTINENEEDQLLLNFNEYLTYKLENEIINILETSDDSHFVNEDESSIGEDEIILTEDELLSKEEILLLFLLKPGVKFGNISWEIGQYLKTDGERFFTEEGEDFTDELESHYELDKKEWYIYVEQ